jgi:hypothetical protein
MLIQCWKLPLLDGIASLGIINKCCVLVCIVLVTEEVIRMDDIINLSLERQAP